MFLPLQSAQWRQRQRQRQRRGSGCGASYFSGTAEHAYEPGHMRHQPETTLRNLRTTWTATRPSPGSATEPPSTPTQRPCC
ncbi:hypothetical protein VM95_11520 [Streptomyces rubellomurinus]|uniref:Uncharacterized protein n=1 Tax=Streptomyces rubellomurinus (strain ATCC 31215) TaxID=359131 RepID=A0A0F2TFJ1_STRR3|nr:hypothetical protein VM95_11520 [Streptomyces rubellomurinus]